MSISYGQTPGTSMAEAICQLYTCMSVCLALPGHPHRERMTVKNSTP